MIKQTNELTPRELNKIKQLSEQCRRVDGSAPNIYQHLLSQKRALPASLLYYNKNDQLIAFLSAFFFYNDACEVALFVAPTLRKKGIATKLLQRILPLVKSQNLSTLIFSSPGKRNDALFIEKGFQYKHTEYNMVRKHNKPVNLDNYKIIDVKPATLEMIPELTDLDLVCFPKEHNDNPTNYENLLANKDEYQLFAVFQEDILVGKAHLRMTVKGVTYSDIAISPKLQGQGIGSALLAYCINYSITIGKTRLALDVEAKNDRALQLYRNFDFVEYNVTDYWSILWADLPALAITT